MQISILLELDLRMQSFDTAVAYLITTVHSMKFRVKKFNTAIVIFMNIYMYREQ